MKNIKLGSTNIPTQKESLTASYTATNWKDLPVRANSNTEDSSVTVRASSNSKKETSKLSY